MSASLAVKRGRGRPRKGEEPLPRQVLPANVADASAERLATLAVQIDGVLSGLPFAEHFRSLTGDARGTLLQALAYEIPAFEATAGMVGRAPQRRTGPKQRLAQQAFMSQVRRLVKDAGVNLRFERLAYDDDVISLCAAIGRAVGDNRMTFSRRSVAQSVSVRIVGAPDRLQE